MENTDGQNGLTQSPTTLPQTTVQPQTLQHQPQYPTPFSGNNTGIPRRSVGYPGLTQLPAMSYGQPRQTGYPGQTGYPRQTGYPVQTGYPGYTGGYPGFTGAQTGGYPGFTGGYPGYSGAYQVPRTGAYPGAYSGLGQTSYGGYQPGLRSSLLAQPSLTTQPVALNNTNQQDTVTARVEETLRRSRVIGEALQRSRAYGNGGQFPGLNSGYANLYGGTGYGYPRPTYGQTLAPQVVAPQVLPQTYAPQVQQSYVPQVQQSYVPQVQQSYVPQVQQSYHQQPQVYQQPSVYQQPRTVLQQPTVHQQPFQQAQPLRRSLGGLTAQPQLGNGAYNGVYGGYPVNRGVGVQRSPATYGHGVQRSPATYGQGTTPVDQGYREYVLRKSKELVEQQAMQDEQDEE